MKLTIREIEGMVELGKTDPSMEKYLQDAKVYWVLKGSPKGKEIFRERPESIEEAEVRILHTRYGGTP